MNNFETFIISFMIVIISMLYFIYQMLCNIKLENKKIMHLLTVENYKAPESIPIIFSIDSGYSYNFSSIIEDGKHSISLQNGVTAIVRNVEYFIKRMTIDIIFTNDKKTVVNLTTGRTSNFEIPKGENIKSLQLQGFDYYPNAKNPESRITHLTLQQCLTEYISDPIVIYTKFVII